MQAGVAVFVVLLPQRSTLSLLDASDRIGEP
jgi:hypothetical protein